MVNKKPPKTIEELKHYLDTHQDEGKINGQYLFQHEVKEYRGGFVPSSVYNLALLRGAAFSFTKSDIGREAFLRFATNPAVIAGTRQKIIQSPIPTGKTEFRAYIPTGLHDLVVAKQEAIGLNNAEVMTLALSLFIFDPAFEAIYNNFVSSLAQTYNCSVEDIENKIFDYWRHAGRVNRYNLSLERGYFVDDHKLS